MAEGDAAGAVDLVVADSVAGAVDAWVRWVGPFTGGEGFGGGASAQGAVGSAVVVVGDEGVELGLELLLGVGRVLFGQVALEGLVEAFDLAAGLGVVGAGVLGADAEGQQFGFDGAEVVAASRAVKMAPLSVRNASG